MTKVEISKKVTNRSQNSELGDDPGCRVYSAFQLESIIRILEKVSPASGLPAFFANERPGNSFHREFGVRFKADLDTQGLTAAGYTARIIAFAAETALAAYDEVGGHEARTKRRKAERLARQLKKLIEDDTVFQDFRLPVYEPSEGSVSRAQIVEIMGTLEGYAKRQIELPNFPSTPSDVFTLKRYLGWTIVNQYDILSGRKGGFASGVKHKPHGPLIDLIICCINPVLERIGEKTMNNHAAGDLVRKVRESLPARWTDLG